MMNDDNPTLEFSAIITSLMKIVFRETNAKVRANSVTVDNWHDKLSIFFKVSIFYPITIIEYRTHS